MPETTRIIDEKRQGLCLDDLDIQSFVGGVASGEVTDAQLGAFTMAVRFNGMSAREQTMMTLAMRDSGIVLDWADVNGPVLDKHSTGGVGDWVSLVLAPLAAAAGAYVPMISGRGLGHTGGTLDKLESIPGFSTQLELAQLRKLVRKNGLAMVGQGPELAPADGRTYAIRDVCSTVESVPLIVSSILSKKLAEGLDGLVLDVKTGNVAFMQAIGDSRLLAENLCRTAQQAGIACRALVTDMNQPLGHNAGNALEIREAIDFMTGARRNPNMTDVVVALTSHMLVMGELAADMAEALELLRNRVRSGVAAEYFARMISAQGGPADLLENPDTYLPSAPVIKPLLADSSGWLASVDTRAVGLAVLRLGGGRVSVEDTIDPRVGISDLVVIGDRIEMGQPVCTIHAANEDDWAGAKQRMMAALGVKSERPESPKIIYETIS